MAVVAILARAFALLLLGGSWVIRSSVISRITMVITYIRGLITPLATTHEPPRSNSGCAE